MKKNILAQACRSHCVWLIIRRMTIKPCINIIEPRHDKTNVVGLRPEWILTRLPIRTVWSGSMLFTYKPYTSRETDSKQHWSWSDCAEAQAGLDPCLSQTHCVGFLLTRFNIITKQEKINISFLSDMLLKKDKSILNYIEQRTGFLMPWFIDVIWYISIPFLCYAYFVY
jgi:hypothetical protein